MPYIPQQIRLKLDKHIDALGEEIRKQAGDIDPVVAFAGLLNYSCTRLALEVIPQRRYWAIALVTGIFKNIADEFYRRYGIPYEQEQITKNGDVY
jgi:Domain of unknown function (DUF6899)